MRSQRLEQCATRTSRKDRSMQHANWTADQKEKAAMSDALPTFKAVRDDLFERALAKHGGRLIPAAKEIGVSYQTIWRWAEKKAACNAIPNG